MNKKELKNWRDERLSIMGVPMSPHPRFLKSTIDDIIIMAIPASSSEYMSKSGNLFAEGVVVYTNTTRFPLYYYSFAWCLENFEEIEGDIKFYEKGNSTETNLA